MNNQTPALTDAALNNVSGGTPAMCTTTRPIVPKTRHDTAKNSINNVR
jgi:hypothetical protein